jgi:hypothetical protein
MHDIAKIILSIRLYNISITDEKHTIASIVSIITTAAIITAY